MDNKFDHEMKNLRAAGASGDGEALNQRLSSLQREIESSRQAQGSIVGCEMAEEGLSISVNSQAVGLWKIDGSELALYRPGSPAAECHVSTVAAAAKMTARLVAAAGQA